RYEPISSRRTTDLNEYGLKRDQVYVGDRAAFDGLVSCLTLLVSDAAGGESGGRLVGGGCVPCRAEPLGQARGEGRQAEFVGCRVRDHAPVVEQQGRWQPVALAHRRKCGRTGLGPSDTMPFGT